ncbi:ROK family transcriptional regulator [Pseudogracilibacillus sp. SE30717A]|uniref:ROK family transcriptional regulator n=1 Tax=Pseudogracilibacillus sp. SE30717A TaxID=3098293 RepID=UPI00300E2E3F
MTTKSKTWNQHIVKRENKNLVLNTIKNKAPISRADIAELTGLNKGTVSSMVAELLEDKLIFESGPGESSGGRRPVMLLFNTKAGYAIGVDLGVNYLLCALTDLDGNIVQEKSVNIYGLDFQKTKEKLFSLIESLISSTPSSAYGIIGIGIGVPGIVNNREMLLLAPNLNWRNIDLKEIIENKFSIPVIVENEANAGAYGEKKFGAGKEMDHIIYVSVGVGIGVGLILNGELFGGHNGFSGELGHMTIDVNGEICRCGNIGCWELYASEHTLLRNAQQFGIELPNNEELTIESLVALAEKDNIQAINLFKQIGKYLGVGINNIINIFNPQQVIIGNRIVHAKKWISETLNDQLANETINFQQQDLKIDFAKLDKYSSVLGMAANAIESFLEHEMKE